MSRIVRRKEDRIRAAREQAEREEQVNVLGQDLRQQWRWQQRQPVYEGLLSDSGEATA